MKEKLNEESIAGYLEKADGWKLEESKWIVKKYRFREFLSAIQFVNEIAQISERLNHHPFISIDYKAVTLRMTSWNAGGLTKLDFTSAAEFDRAYVSHNS